MLDPAHHMGGTYISAYYGYFWPVWSGTWGVCVFQTLEYVQPSVGPRRGGWGQGRGHRRECGGDAPVQRSGRG